MAKVQGHPIWGLRKFYHKEYSAWQGCIRRCTDPGNPNYPDYGGRGIRVCDRWRESFWNFLEDMKLCPHPAFSLDRYPDNDGNYEPGNCRWASAQQQSLNKRTSDKWDNTYLEFYGETLTVRQWANKISARPEDIWHRSRMMLRQRGAATFLAAKSRKNGRRRKLELPRLLLHKASGQGYIFVDGKAIYFGRFGSDECNQEYMHYLEIWKREQRAALVNK